MRISDITGFTLRDAKEILKALGVDIRNICVTAPPKAPTCEYDDGYRVVRYETIEGNKIDLLVCKPL